VGIHPHDDLAFGRLDSDVHARWGNPAYIVKKLDPRKAFAELENYFSRPIITLTIHYQ
jgi:hypothetical protein